jgi:uncharacterized protein YkwD
MSALRFDNCPFFLLGYCLVFRTPKQHILISVLVALDILLLANIYQKKVAIFEDKSAEAATINKSDRVLGTSTRFSWKNFSFRRTNATPTPARSSVSKAPTPTPTAVGTAQASTPTPTNKPTSTPSPKISATPSPKPITPNPTKATINSPTPTPTAHAQSQMQNQSQVQVNYSISDEAKRLLSQVNDFRASKGKGPVTPEKYTCDFANLRAGEIVSNFSHDGFRQRIDSKTLPYPSYSSVAENIAMNSNPDAVVPAWINSSGHAENMLKDVPHGCIGVSGRYYTYLAWKP